mmetsp:Transcript_19574/g.32513  ORF Transcript_19574/g.32513 Transcript_19574/m.32513 type:complete len:91 (+) Transcript_19574:820-1092(+)
MKDLRGLAAIRRFPKDFSHREIDFVIEIRLFLDGEGQLVITLVLLVLKVIRSQDCDKSESLSSEVTLAFAISANNPERKAELYEDIATSL